MNKNQFANECMTSQDKIKTYILKLPKNFCIYDQTLTADTIKFISNLSDIGITKNSLIRIDFSNVQSITAAASVLLFSEISRVRALSVNGFNTIKIISPSNGEIRAHLNSMGFMRAINIDMERFPDSLWKGNTNFISGNNPKEDFTKVTNLIKDMYSIKKLPHKLSASISETLLNVLHHAYLPMQIGTTVFKVPEFVNHRWWSCFQVYKVEEISVLKCVILDRGQGICSTISPPYHMQLKGNNPLEALMLAMKTGISRTRNPERGKGSEDIRMPVDLTQNERDFISILSHNVSYTLLGNSQPSFDFLKDRIPGTVVEWQLEF